MEIQNQKVSKIEEYKLEEIVEELRAIYSREKAAQIINERYLQEGQEPISQYIIQRWEEKKQLPVSDKREAGAVLGKPINTYEEMVGLLSKTDRSLTKIAKKIEDLEDIEKSTGVSKNQDLIYLLTMQEKLMARKQAIIKDITNYQIRIRNQENIDVLNKVVIEELKQYPEIFSKVLARLKKHREVMDMVSMTEMVKV